MRRHCWAFRRVPLNLGPSAPIRGNERFTLGLIPPPPVAGRAGLNAIRLMDFSVGLALLASGDDLSSKHLLAALGLAAYIDRIHGVYCTPALSYFIAELIMPYNCLLHSLSILPGEPHAQACQLLSRPDCRRSRLRPRGGG